jgi:protein phosphatase
MEVVWGARTDRGLVRELNEDAYLTEPPVFLVADGMGGHRSGKTASAAVIEEFQAATAGRGDVQVTPEWVTERLGGANTRIRAGAGGGTTAVGVALVDRDELPYWLVFNIGDSRAYLHTGHELRQISVDHSVVQELVDAGQLTQDRARFHPERHIVTRAVGTPATPQPDFWLVPREPGDRMLLCSDGITSELGDDDIAAALGRPDPAQRVAENLTALALRAGGRDNITCIVVDALPLGDRVGAAPDEDRDETRPRHRPDSLGVGR